MTIVSCLGFRIFSNMAIIRCLPSPEAMKSLIFIHTKAQGHIGPSDLTISCVTMN